MSKGLIIGSIWVVFLASGVIATVTEYFFPLMICIFSGIGGMITTGVWISDNWEDRRNY